MSNLERRPIGKNPGEYPYALAHRIATADIKGTTFCERIPCILELSMEKLFRNWIKQGCPNQHPFLILLGINSNYYDVKQKPNFSKESSPFDLWLEEAKTKEGILDSNSDQVPVRVSTQLINFFINQISGYKEREFNELAGLLTGIQIVSTNQIFSPDYARAYLELLGKGNIFYSLPYFLFELLQWKFEDEKGTIKLIPNDLNNNIIRLFHNHLLAFLINYESSFKVSRNLLKSFFAIISNKDNCLTTIRY